MTAPKQTSNLVLFYSASLVAISVATVLVVGTPALAAIVSSLPAALMAAFFAFQMRNHNIWALWAGLLESLLFTLVFGWMAGSTLVEMMELAHSPDEVELMPKAIAFLGLTALSFSSLFTSAIQVMYFGRNVHEIETAV